MVFHFTTDNRMDRIHGVVSPKTVVSGDECVFSAVFSATSQQLVSRMMTIL